MCFFIPPNISQIYRIVCRKYINNYISLCVPLLFESVVALVGILNWL